MNGSGWRVDELLDAIRQEQEPRHDEAVEIVRHLFRLFITADEVSHGAGFLTLDHASADADAADSLELRSANNLFLKWWPSEARPPLSSLCERVHPTRAIVLPKIHVSQSGLTLNNLTRNLALCDIGADIAPVWRWIVSPYHRTSNRDGINLLLIPHPFNVRPSSFKSAKLDVADSDTGYFSSEPGELTDKDHQRVLAAAELVAKWHGRLDAVVLPEMATDGDSFEQLCRNLMRWASADRDHRGGVVVVGGVGESSANAYFGENKAAVSFDLAGFRVAPGNQQSKHHRWRLDGGQIDQYGLGAQLDPRKVWWEHIALPQRAIYFWAAGWLTMSVLICEDLARQEPVAEIVRAVGPNLVIALLADGPQLEKRWSARYAAVLADDPGCSVLTLTSLGMTELSRQPRNTESRAIALWKDAKSGAREIELPHGAFGLVLSVTRESASANTADGRTGEKQARLHLSGVHPIMLDDVDCFTRTEDDFDCFTGTEPAPDTRYPMLQPYQATALSMALCSRIRSSNSTKLPENGWPEALAGFSRWLNDAPPHIPEESQFWHALNNDDDLKSVIRCLYDDKAVPASGLDTQVAELRRLLPG